MLKCLIITKQYKESREKKVKQREMYHKRWGVPE